MESPLESKYSTTEFASELFQAKLWNQLEGLGQGKAHKNIAVLTQIV